MRCSPGWPAAALAEIATGWRASASAHRKHSACRWRQCVRSCADSGAITTSRWHCGRPGGSRHVSWLRWWTSPRKSRQHKWTRGPRRSTTGPSATVCAFTCSIVRRMRGRKSGHGASASRNSRAARRLRLLPASLFTIARRQTTSSGRCCRSSNGAQLTIATS